MARARVLPTIQLMPLRPAPAIPLRPPPVLGGPPGKNERPHPLLARTSGNPSIIMSPDQSSVDPDKAVRRHAQRNISHRTFSHRRHT